MESELVSGTQYPQDMIFVMRVMESIGLEVKKPMTCSSLKWSTFLRKRHKGTNCQNWILAKNNPTVLYGRGDVRFIKIVCFRLTLASSKAPWQKHQIVQMKITIHSTCIVECIVTFICIKWITSHVDNIDARCVVDLWFSFKPMESAALRRLSGALTRQTANLIGSKGFLIAKLFYVSRQIGLLTAPSIISHYFPPTCKQSPPIVCVWQLLLFYFEKRLMGRGIGRKHKANTGNSKRSRTSAAGVNIFYGNGNMKPNLPSCLTTSLTIPQMVQQMMLIQSL